MKNDFDKHIKGLLDSSAPEAAGFGLDKAQVWKRVEAKQRNNTIPFRKWISHAAAVVIGILLCLPFLFRPGKESVRTVTVVKHIPAERRIQDTVYVVQQAAPATQRALRAENKKVKPSVEVIVAKEIKPEEKLTDTNNAGSPEPVIAKTETHRSKMEVLHLTDIENENAAPKARSKDGYTLFNKINFPARMEDRSETFSIIVSNQFSNSKK